MKPTPSGADYSVTSWVHNTETYSDEVKTTAELENPGPYVGSTTQREGFYCRHTTRIDVFHADALDGTSRLVSTQNDLEACPIPPLPPIEPGPPTGAGGLDNDPNAPANAVLLKRQCKPAFGGGFTYTDKYYDPATRTIVSLNSATGYVADTCTVYTKPSDEVVDRYCLEPGVAPFTERRVFFDGLNDLFTQDVDNVLSCQRPACTLTVTAIVTPAGLSGLGSATLVPLGAQGEVRFQRVGQPADQGVNPVFVDLPVGTYDLRVFETRPDGCSATVRVTITAQYGVRYRLCFRDQQQRRVTLLLRERGYLGPEEKIIGQADAVTVDWPGGALDHVHTTLLRGSECELRLLLTYTGQMLDTFSGDERLYQVELLLDNNLFWRGYLLPEQYTVAHLAPPVTFVLRATDGLGALEGVPFAGPEGRPLRGQWSLLQVLQHCLARLDLNFPLHVLSTLLPRGGLASQCPLAQAFVDVAQYADEKGKPFSCGKVVQEILGVQQMRLLQQDGAWWLERLADLSPEALTYWVFAPDGTQLAPLTRTLLRTVTQPTVLENRLAWRRAAQTKSIRGAIKSVLVKAEPGELVNLLADYALDAAQVDAAGRPQGWSGAAPVQVLPAQKRNESGTLLLRGAAPGATPEAADFIQTPASLPVPTGGSFLYPLQVRFTATLRSLQPLPADTPQNLLPRLLVGLRHGQQWLGMGATPGIGAQRLVAYTFDKLDQAVTVELGGYGRTTQEAEAVVLRFLQVTAPAGRAAYDVEISNLELRWGTLGYEEEYVDETYEQSELLVTRHDESQVLFHTDTPQVRLRGSLLDARGFPTEEWFLLSAPAVLAPLHAFLVRDRFSWQSGPAQVLSGPLQGELRPGDLLTDPMELRPAVYLLPTATYNVKTAEWTITAVQLRTLLPLGVSEAVPVGAFYTEDDFVLVAEGRASTQAPYLLSEDAAS
ncbi:hypothetical protein ACW9KT_15625 [Hymenobacter sp. HD11105]